MKGKVEELSRPPLGEIRVIIGGSLIGQSSRSRKTYLKVVQNFQLSGRPPRMRGANEHAITFTNDDARRVHHPHDNAIVITLLIADYTTKRVLVDNGSSADILYYPRLPTNEAWTKSASSSKFALGRIWRNESATCGHHYTTCSGGSISTTDNQGSKFPCGGLFVFL